MTSAETEAMPLRYDYFLSTVLVLRFFTASTKSINVTTEPPPSRLYQYQVFEQNDLSADEYNSWIQGTTCRNLDPRPNSTSGPLGIIHCPMPFEDVTYRFCCGEAASQICCHSGDNGVAAKWGIAVGVILACFVTGVMAVCLFNKFSYVCTRPSPSGTPRPKIKINASRQSVRPAEKRILMKTANYTVEQSWDQLIVKFTNQDYYDAFADAVISRYHGVTWRDSKKEKEGLVSTSTGDRVNLRLIYEPRVLIVTLQGNSVWVMNDFQNICKNLRITENGDLKTESSSSQRPLTPRLPTIGEEFYDAGEYVVKISQTETEIKFSAELLFDNFKRVLLYKYPTLPWSKYLQRDCAQLKLTSGKAVTIHLWEDVRTIWLSGDGRKDWYHAEFQDLFSDAAKGKLPEVPVIKTATSSRASSAASRSGGHSPASTTGLLKEYPAVYTVKTLDTGGFEIEFPTYDFLPKIKDLLEKSYSSLTWQEYTSRHVTTIYYENRKSVSIHIASPSAQLRRMWIYDDPGCKDWFNTDFRKIYAAAYKAIYRPENPPTEEKNPVIAPVETTL